MTKLGISLYPEQESIEEIEKYIKLAGKYGFSKIFTSLFSVSGDVEEVSNYFKNLCEISHKYGMEVCADVNAGMFEKFGASENNISVFKDIGIDELRMDFCFCDERDQILVANKEKIKIQFSAFMVDAIKPIVEKVKNIPITVCHNFYPERYTGVPKNDFKRLNKIWEIYENVEIAAFISSNVEKAHGPWPVYDGLPTIEDHRGRSVDFQVRELGAMGNVDTIYFGNAFASEEEFKEAKEAITFIDKKNEDTEFERMIRGMMPNVGKKRILFKIDPVNNLNEVETKILYDFEKHCDLGDTSEYMLRSRITRTIYGKENIPFRSYEENYFKKGDVLIVNDNLKHYRGELEICLKDMENDGQRNFVGRLNEDEVQLLDYILPGVYFRFK